VADVFKTLGCETDEKHHEFSDGACRQINADRGVVVCVKRNMFDVVVSWYHNRNMSLHADWTFDEFVIKQVCNYSEINHRWFSNPIYHYGLPFCHVRLRYENLREDLKAFLREWGYDIPKLPHIGKSDRKDYQDYYSVVSKTLIEDRWAEDLYLTGYKF